VERWNEAGCGIYFLGWVICFVVIVIDKRQHGYCCASTDRNSELQSAKALRHLGHYKSHLSTSKRVEPTQNETHTYLLHILMY
jgi:hypothetical protein